MTSRETQTLIKATALALFNDNGTAHVSTNAVAKHCGISKGNLHYHFPTKRHLILALYRDILAEMEQGWYGDERQPTVTHMAEMFTRQLELVWRYRFFYREMASLVRDSSELQQCLRLNRRRRMAAVERFFRALVEAGVLTPPRSKQSLHYLVTMTWIFSDNWLNFIEVQGETADEHIGHLGYDMIIEMLYPYLTEKARREIYPSYAAIRAEYFTAGEVG